MNILILQEVFSIKKPIQEVNFVTSQNIVEVIFHLKKRYPKDMTYSLSFLPKQCIILNMVYSITYPNVSAVIFSNPHNFLKKQRSHAFSEFNYIFH